MQDAPERMNESGTRSPIEAKSEQVCSLDVLASHLARLRPGHPAGAHISLLIGQLENYERNPVLLKPMILMTCRRIEEARQ